MNDMHMSLVAKLELCVFVLLYLCMSATLCLSPSLSVSVSLQACMFLFLCVLVETQVSEPKIQRQQMTASASIRGTNATTSLLQTARTSHVFLLEPVVVMCFLLEPVGPLYSLEPYSA